MKAHSGSGRCLPVQVPALITALFCLLPVTGRAASGSCNARYEAVITKVSDKPANKVVQFGDFQSQGKGRDPLDAGISARRNAEQCMQSQWKGRMDEVVPYECMDQQRIIGYGIQDFEKTVQWEVCQALRPVPCTAGRPDIQYSLYAVVDGGGAGCGTRMSPISRTLLADGVMTQCKCRDDQRPLPTPRQVSPVQGVIFYHLPRRVLLSWQPVPHAKNYVVEIKYNGKMWSTLNASGEATFVSFDFPGPGQGEWRVIPQGRRGRQGTPSPWAGFIYQR